MSEIKNAALAAPLEHASLIEASAGTGKTWTLAGLFVRLVAEKGLPVDGILAVTFTRAATAELRERIRRKFQDLLDVLDGRPVLDAFCTELAARLDGGAGRDLAKQRLTAALRGFDDAAIYTIHGFCQRVLADRAFSSGMPFDTEILPSIRQVLTEIVADFWRMRIASPDLSKPGSTSSALHQAFVDWLIGKRVTPGVLETWVRTQLPRRDMRIDRNGADQQREASIGCLQDRLELAAVWCAHRNTIVALLETHPGLDRNTYRKTSIVNWAIEVDSYFIEGGDSYDLPKNFERFTVTRIAAGCKGEPPPAHPFFPLAEAYKTAIDELTQCFQALLRQIKLDLFDTVRRQLRKRLRERRVQTYDDLLLNLHEALHAAAGTGLAAALRQRYPAALIDEFQDTDPLQYAIFRRIYLLPGDAATLFLIGDPKQAIYSFRGADLFTYLDAVSDCERQYTLTDNQRSAPSLVRALNTLFGAAVNPFRFEQIRYSAVQAAIKERASLHDDSEADGGQADAAPLRVFLQKSAPDGNPVSKAAAKAWAAETTAAEIARLLNDARLGKLRLGERPLLAGDIAVLVNTHAQGAAVRRALNQAGIACSEQSTDSVFGSPEAEQLERLLLALIRPQHEARVCSALACDLFACSATELAAFDENQLSWQMRLNDFERYQDLWRQNGFMRMFRRLITEQRVAERLASFADGERRLTNLFHLAELLHAKGERLPGMQAQLNWLSCQRRGDDDSSEESQLRLESDENLVQVVTIHRGKGLEYAVTFTPFLWDGHSRLSKDEAVFYHDPADGNRAVLDFASERRDQALAHARGEELAERIRIAYVALTRAKNRCYLFWGRIKEADRSPLAWLLHGVHRADGGLALPDDSGIRGTIDALAVKANGAIRTVEPRAASALLKPSAADAMPLSARKMTGRVPQPWRLSSFSSLQRAAADDWRAEAPDHDQAAALIGDVRKSASAQPGGGRFTFPRGSTAGDCLHTILERISLSAPPANWQSIAAAGLREAGYGEGEREQWPAELSRWLGAVLHTPLEADEGNSPILARLDDGSVLKELEFHLPLHAADPARLSAIAARHGLAIPTLARAALDGYLKGYIDLVFRHDGHFYIADYKSNWLGDAPADYGREPIEAAMAREGYHLQYLIYCTALHRWLRRRIPDYDYARHVGGVFYLFLRGMDPAWRNADGSARGVFRYKPPRALIETLDRALGAVGKAQAERV